jgi:hypothetical protein
VLAATAVGGGIIGALTTIAVYLGSFELGLWNSPPSSAVPAVGLPRDIQLNCTSLDSIRVDYRQPVVPQEVGEPPFLEKVLEGSDLRAIILHETILLRRNRYWYLPNVELRLAPGVFPKIQPALPHIQFLNINLEYRLELAPGLDSFDFKASESDSNEGGSLTFLSAEITFDQLLSLVQERFGCSISPPAA